MELIDRIREAAFEEFMSKGPRFTMEDLARRLGISKKTLYECVRDKEELFEMFVDEAFASIKGQEREIAGNASLDPIARFVQVVSIMPVFGRTFDYDKVRELEDLYPAIRKRIENHIETDWESTLAIFDQAVRQGLLRDVDRWLVREVLFSAMEQMLHDDFLAKTGRNYQETMHEIVSLVIEGLRIKRQ